MSIKQLDDPTRREIARTMFELHVKGGLSLNDIAGLIGNKTSGYTSRLCRQLGISPRPFEEARLKGIREKRRKCERRPFDGNDEDRAYLLGLRHGDLSVYKPWKGAVRVSTSTTHPAMADLFRSLFERYGHVYQFPRYKKDTMTYEWNLQVILDESFGFLTNEITTDWKGFAASRNTSLAYLAGIWDAEGSVGIFRNSKVTAVQLSVYNTNLRLLNYALDLLRRLGFHPLGPYLAKPKGTSTSKYGIVRQRDYWKIVLAGFDESQSLLRQLGLRHQEKISRKELAISIPRGTRWTAVNLRVSALRDRIKSERDGFVQQAEIKCLSRSRVIPTAG